MTNGHFVLQLHHRKEEAASIKKEHAAVEGEVRTLCKQVSLALLSH